MSKNASLFSPVLLSLLLAARFAAAQTAPPPTEAPPAGGGDTEKAPVQLGKQGGKAEEAPPLPPRAPRTVWVGWNFGSGYGWHTAGNLETNTGHEVSAAFGPGLLGYFGPEVGYQVDDRLSITLQGRHQVVPKKMPDPTVTLKPKQWAHAALVRAAYRFPFERFTAYGAGVLGGGDGFRFRIDPQPGMAKLDSSDTVRGGPIVIGPAAGIVFPFAKGLSVVGETRLLSGLPHFAVMMDFTLGLQFDVTSL